MENPAHGMSTVRKPTAAQMEEGPVYVLIRRDWRHHDWHFHGFNYAVQFRGGRSEIYGPHFEQWIGDTKAAKLRMQVIKSVPEPVPEPKPEPVPESKPKPKPAPQKKRRYKKKGTK